MLCLKFEFTTGDGASKNAAVEHKTNRTEKPMRIQVHAWNFECIEDCDIAMLAPTEHASLGTSATAPYAVSGSKNEQSA